MALPKIDLPLFKTTLPISGKVVSFRPFTVKEEKILLISKEAATPTDLVGAILQIVDNCTLGALDLNSLPVVDIEFLFLQIRIKSVGEISELRYTCYHEVDGERCGGKIDINLDLSAITTSTSDIEGKIKLTDTIGISLRYPTVDDSLYIISDIAGGKDVNNDVGFLYRILDFVWDGDEIFPKNEITQDELVDFIEGLSSDQFKLISNFIDALPSMKKEIPTKCPKCGHESSLTLEGLQDFF